MCIHLPDPPPVTEPLSEYVAGRIFALLGPALLPVTPSSGSHHPQSNVVRAAGFGHDLRIVVVDETTPCPLCSETMPCPLCSETISKLRAEAVRLRAEAVKLRAEVVEAVVERERWIARMQDLERRIDAARGALDTPANTAAALRAK